MSRQIPHLGIFLHVARFLDARKGLPMDAQGVHQLTDVRMLLGQLLHDLRARKNLRIRQLGRQLLGTALDGG